MYLGPARGTDLQRITKQLDPSPISCWPEDQKVIYLKKVRTRGAHYIIGYPILTYIFANYTISYIFLLILYIVWTFLYLNYIENDKVYLNNTKQDIFTANLLLYCDTFYDI